MELIETKTVGTGGASFVEFTSIPATYTDLKLVASARSNRSGSESDDFKITINNNTSATYTNRRLYGSSGTAGSDGGSSTGLNNAYSGQLTASTATANTFGSTEFYFPNYRSGTSKCWSADGVSENNATANANVLSANLVSDTNPITIIKLEGYNGNTLQEFSTFSLYGISSVTSTPKATGGIVSQDASYWYHTFPFTSTFTPTQAITCDYLVIAGGAAGGAGGGGAGGLRSTVTATGGGGTLESRLSLTAQAYTVTVGAGGTGGGGGLNTGNAGSNSTFSTITSVGGGGGGPYNNGAGVSGGSGGGAGSRSAGSVASGGSGTTNQGYAGGNGRDTGTFEAGGGGGGGAGAAGNPSPNTSNYDAGNGGNGVSIPAFANATFTGVSTYYAGGGGGASRGAGDGLGGIGGLGGGGLGRGSNGGPEAGVINTGSGSGGDQSTGTTKSGGSGLVIVRYAK